MTRVSIDAGELAAAHAKAASARTRFLLWQLSGGTLTLSGNGADFRARAKTSVENLSGEFMVAMPSATVSAWLKGVTGPLEIEVEGVVATFKTERSSIEVGIITHGEEIALHANWPSAEDAQVIGLTGEVWAAINEVVWACGTSRTEDNRARAVHIGEGAVIGMAVHVGLCAAIHMDIDIESHWPMIPPGAAEIGKWASPEALVVVDGRDLLHVIDDDSAWVAPMYGGEPMTAGLFERPALTLPKTEGVQTHFSRKAMLDMIARLDRVDADQAARGTDLKARVHVQADGSLLSATVRVGEHQATETIDCDGAPVDQVFALPLLRATVNFAVNDLVTFSKARTGPWHMESENREAWLMGMVSNRMGL